MLKVLSVTWRIGAGICALGLGAGSVFGISALVNAPSSAINPPGIAPISPGTPTLPAMAPRFTRAPGLGNMPVNIAGSVPNRVTPTLRPGVPATVSSRATGSQKPAQTVAPVSSQPVTHTIVPTVKPTVIVPTVTPTPSPSIVVPTVKLPTVVPTIKTTPTVKPIASIGTPTEPVNSKTPITPTVTGK